MCVVPRPSVKHSEERRVQRVSDPYPPPCTTMSSSSARDLQNNITHTRTAPYYYYHHHRNCCDDKKINTKMYKEIASRCGPDYIVVFEVMHMCTVLLLSEYSSHAEMLEPINNCFTNGRYASNAP